MREIRFSENWDKLSRPYGFTTIRKFTPEKYDYYVQNIGRLFSVLVRGDYFYDAILKSVATVEPKSLDQQLLIEDTKLNGKIDCVWYNTITNMERAILLEFERENKRGKLAVITDLAEFEGYLGNLGGTEG
jgi:hypothetical protein